MTNSTDSNATTLTKGDFDKFWAEVLGRDWFIDEWDGDDAVADGGDDSATLTLTVLDRGWQGLGNPRSNEYLTSRDLDNCDTMHVLRRWLDRQPMRHVAAYVPSAAFAEFQDFVTRVGGHL